MKQMLLPNKIQSTFSFKYMVDHQSLTPIVTWRVHGGRSTPSLLSWSSLLYSKQPDSLTKTLCMVMKLKTYSDSLFKRLIATTSPSNQSPVVTLVAERLSISFNIFQFGEVSHSFFVLICGYLCWLLVSSEPTRMRPNWSKVSEKIYKIQNIK